MKIEINNMLTNLIEKNIHKIFYFFSIIIIFTTFFLDFKILLIYRVIGLMNGARSLMQIQIQI